MNTVELCWNITSYVSIIVQLIVAGICLGIFVSPYMPGGSKAVKAGAVYGMVMTVLYIMPPRIDNILAYLIGTSAAFAVTVFLILSFLIRGWRRGHGCTTGCMRQ